MVEAVDAGLPTRLGPVDHLLYRREAHPRARLGSVGVVLFDITPDWSRFCCHFENASRRVLRLRQKVVTPTLPTAAPRWVVDPDFDVDFHVGRVRVPEPGTLREVFDLAEAMLQSPMDTSRPLWTATLVEGLADGTAAMIFRLSHAIADGVGGVDMFGQIGDRERDPSAETPPPPPSPQELSPDDVMWEGINHLLRVIAGGVRGALWKALSTVGRVVLNPLSALAGVVGYARSMVRVMRRTAKPSPVLRQRSLVFRTEALDIRLSDLQRAAKAGGGSVNDAYLAGLCGALRRYHQALGVPVDTLLMWVPVNLRADTDPAGGNMVGGVALVAPVGMADPVARMRNIGAQMTRRRDEPARDINRTITKLLSVLPAAVLDAISGGMAVDVVASNVASYPGDIYLAGAKVLRQYGLSWVPGVGMVALLLSAGEWCTVTVSHDRAAVEDAKLFARCLREGFDEILAVTGDPGRRAVPRSFALDGDGR